MADEIKTPGAEEEYQPDLMTLEDEDGNEVTFEVIDALDHKGVHYLAVVVYANYSKLFIATDKTLPQPVMYAAEAAFLRAEGAQIGRAHV